MSEKKNNKGKEEEEEEEEKGRKEKKRRRRRRGGGGGGRGEDEEKEENEPLAGVIGVSTSEIDRNKISIDGSVIGGDYSPLGGHKLTWIVNITRRGKGLHNKSFGFRRYSSVYLGFFFLPP
ncbi:hypothetical protein ElyMa_004830100 [Elysia marginata]|uniref:Uncharacterized protein n=1 Tax=Elysia marginata TaxID=1093978 RepID=A0AAV4IMB1_9GAST|nr:hypothetical protein ElyMa_004830100 [Elysia marginata]